MPFPRTAAVYLGQSTLPSAQTLARYDVVVIDNEWAHRKPGIFGEIRAANPSVKILAYISWTDRTDSFAAPTKDPWWSNRNQYLAGIPEQWLATRADGRAVSEFPGSTMINLTDQAPVVRGQQAWQFAADWTVEHILKDRLWDGVMLDVWGDRIFNPGAQVWDINRDGRDETSDQIYGADRPWERGASAAEAVIRKRAPNSIVVVNNVRTFRKSLIDGRVWENFADDRIGREWAFDVKEYVDGSGDPMRRQPGLQMTFDHAGTDGGRTPDDLRRARFYLTSTLLQNGYWSGSGIDYDALPRYDELEGGGLGRGYLGKPIVESPTRRQLFADFRSGVGQLSGGVFRRDFGAGIALVNPGERPILVRLGGTFHRISGKIDPTTNNGAVETEVTVPARDGLILLRDAR